MLVMMQFMNTWNRNSVIVAHNTQMGQFIDGDIYIAVFVVSTMVSDACTDIGVPLLAVKTRLTNILLALTK